MQGFVAMATILTLVTYIGLSFDAQTVHALSCPPCTPERKASCPVLDCPHGIVNSTCGCCKACGKGLGEECGGLWNMKGYCADAYDCELPLSTNPNRPPGKCILKAVPAEETKH